jgi:hypothetical protein
VVRLSVPSRLSIDIAKPLLPQAPGCFLFSSSTQNLFRCFYTVCGTRESCSMSYVQYDETFALQDYCTHQGKHSTTFRNSLPCKSRFALATPCASAAKINFQRGFRALARSCSSGPGQSMKE